MILTIQLHFYNDKDGNYLTSGFEYETIWAFGAHLGIKDLDQIAKIDALMDDLGVDSIETGATLGVAVEAGLIEYGDGEKAYDIIANELAKGTALGRIIGSGAGNLGKLYGLVRVAVVKNQSMPAYDPRAIKGIGVTYATTPMGSDHTAGFTVPVNLSKADNRVDPLKKENQVDLSRKMQVQTAMVDSLGMCNFIARPMLDGPKCLLAMVDMINARFDSELTVDGWKNLGKTILKTEKAFNIRAGLTNAHDRIPEFMRYEPLPPHNTTWDFTGEEIDEFWNF
jgi:aldehyde:ferredoxin oxidoreductase